MHCSIISTDLEHAYVRACLSALSRIYPGVQVVPKGGFNRSMFSVERPSVFHFHWIEPMLRTSSRRTGLGRAAKLMIYLVVLRLQGTRSVWTIHNMPGKNLVRLRLDRLLRAVLVILCSRVVVLNHEAIVELSASFPRALRRLFRAKVRVVPMPLSLRYHGPVLPKQAARAGLGIDSQHPLLAYFGGANQLDHAMSVVDQGGRYELVTVDRDATSGLITKSDSGWTFMGVPDDLIFGQLIASSDAVLLTDPKALGSMTLHAAVGGRRAVLSPRCPAVKQLVEIGGCRLIGDGLECDEIAVVMRRLVDEPVEPRVFEEFERGHADAVVAQSLADVYCELGLPLRK